MTLGESIKPVHAIVGEKAYDSWLAEEALEQILKQAVGDDRTAVEVFRGDESTWSRILDNARTRSLFASSRAVVVRNADTLKGEPEDLDAYLKDPTPGVTLVFLAVKPDRRRAAWKRLLDKASVVKADPPRGRSLYAYLDQQLRRRGLRLDDDAKGELVEHVGQDLRRLNGELDKLEAFGERGREISADDVASVVGKGLARPLYRLADALTERRSTTVLELMEESLEEGEPPLKILAVLHRAVRQVRGAKALREARVPREQMASRLGIQPFKVGDLAAAERKWSEAELKQAVQALGQADRRIKTGADPRVSLVAAVVSACGGGGATTSRRPGR